MMPFYFSELGRIFTHELMQFYFSELCSNLFIQCNNSGVITSNVVDSS